MFCEKCGARIDPGDVFCPECGTKIENDATVKMGYQSGNDQGGYYQDNQRPYHQSPYGENMYGKNEYGQNYSGQRDSQRKQYRPDEEFYRDDYRNRNRREEQKNKDTMLYVFLGILTVLLVGGIIWGIVTLTHLNDDEDAEYEDPGEAATEEIDSDIAEGTEKETEVTVTPEATVEPEVVVTPESTPIPTPIVTATPVPTQVPAASNGDYIFPDSSSRLLSNSDLSGLSEWELRIARNEIYARHGRMFKDSALDSYFRGKSWYSPSIPAESFDDNNILSKTELKNAKLISDYEAAHGYN